MEPNAANRPKRQRAPPKQFVAGPASSRVADPEVEPWQTGRGIQKNRGAPRTIPQKTAPAQSRAAKPAAPTPAAAAPKPSRPQAAAAPKKHPEVSWETLWPALLLQGWTTQERLEGNGKAHTFFPPGVTRENGVRRSDFFDSKKAVIGFLNDAGKLPSISPPPLRAEAKAAPRVSPWLGAIIARSRRAIDPQSHAICRCV
jgi:hypothetical protein